VIAIMSQTPGLIGERLGSFRIESILGSGAMGVVYRGTNEKTKREAAVKVVNGEYAPGGKIRDRFEREAEILQQFRHPNIVRFLAVGRFRGTSYIAMEYVQGDTLEKILTERDHLPWREVVDLAIQMCAALHYAHEHGIVHRDLKPSNLMVTPDGDIKLTDFGIAKDLDATALTATGRTLGTAAYMSPEQIRGTPAVSHKTDLYALGILLYQMLVGKAPFEGNTPVVLMHCHLNEPPPRPSAKITEIPKKLDELIVNLMAKLPSDRPWDAAAVGVTLGELRDKAERGDPIAMVWPSTGRDPARPPRASAASPDRPRKKSRKAGATGGTARSAIGRPGSDSDFQFSWLSRSMIETALLALALVVIGGFIAYRVWPPSKEYLYKQADTLMASSRRSDWLTALDEYVKPLEERFPDNPYRDQTRKWRDKILLDEAESRGRNLASGLDISLTRPVNDAERKFVIAHQLAAGAKDRGDELTSINKWRDFAEQVKADDPDERKWHLLALRNIEQLENAINDRRQYVLKQLQLADAALQAGRLDEGITIKTKLVDQFSRYTDLVDIFGSAPPTTGAPAQNTVPGHPTESSPREKGVAPKPPAPDPAAAAHDPAAHSSGDTDPKPPPHQN
jgi:eukaryotic-like serine/threonine-protein kinase